MNCDTAMGLISARADGELIDGDAVDSHVDGCESCLAFMASLMRVRRELRLSSVEAPVDVTASVLAALDAGRPTLTKTARPAILLAAALVLAISLTGAFLLGQGSRQASVEAVGAPPAVTITSQVDVVPQVDGDSRLAVVWTRDALDSQIEPALRSALVGVTTVRRETVLLTGSLDSSGETVDTPGPGWAIPLDVAAIDTAEYLTVIGDTEIVGDSDAISGLAHGEGVLGETSAELRRLDVGAVLEFGGNQVRISAVVTDTMVGAAELLVDDKTGEALGVTTERYALVRSNLDDAGIQQLLPTAMVAVARVRGEDETPWLRNSDAVLPQVMIKERFGEFAIRPAGDGYEVDPTWFADNIVTTELPAIGSLTCHREIVPLLRDVLAVLDDATVDAITQDQFQGCWNPRIVRSTGDLSRHSWGAAIDLGAMPANQEQAEEVIAAFAAAGFTWGGDWLVADPAHFEFVGDAEP